MLEQVWAEHRTEVLLNRKTNFKGALSGSETIFGNGKPFKNDEKDFLFRLKTSFCSQYNYIFVLIFSPRSKMA